MFTEGEIVTVDPRCGFFVVSSNLSSNFKLSTYLKSCFRAHCLCEPDIDALLKLKLITIGADDPGSLSKKLGLVLKSVKDIFGKESARSFGLRSLLRLLNKFEHLTTANAASEISSLHTALLQVYAPKFDEGQLPLFQSLLLDIVGPAPDQLDANMEELVTNILKEKHAIQSNAHLTKNICQIIDALQTSNRTLIVGETGVGKTLAFEVALSYISLINAETKHSVSRIYPNAISHEWLFGGTESKDHGNPGILISILKRASSTRYAHACQWIIMDGPAQGFWMDQIHIFLEKNKLQTGISETQNRTLQLVVETDCLKLASPSSISVFNVVHVSSRSISHHSIFDTWVLKNGPSFAIDSLANLSKSYLTLLIYSIEKECVSMMDVCVWSKMSAVTSLLESFIDAAKTSNFNFDSQSILRMYAFCFAWGYGAALDDTGRAIINSSLFTHARLSLPS